MYSDDRRMLDRLTSSLTGGAFTASQFGSVSQRRYIVASWPGRSSNRLTQIDRSSAYGRHQCRSQTIQASFSFRGPGCSLVRAGPRRR